MFQSEASYYKASHPPLIAPGEYNHAAGVPFSQFLILKTGTVTAAAEFYNHVDIMSGNIAAPHITKVFVFSKIRADIFRHL